MSRTPPSASSAIPLPSVPLPRLASKKCQIPRSKLTSTRGVASAPQPVTGSSSHNHALPSSTPFSTIATAEMAVSCFCSYSILQTLVRMELWTATSSGSCQCPLPYPMSGRVPPLLHSLLFPRPFAIALSLLCCADFGPFRGQSFATSHLLGGV